MNLETQKESILRKLQDAGSAGLGKTKLGITKTNMQAFNELRESGAIANLGSPSKTCFVLKEFYNPLEKACDEIEKLLKTPMKPNELKALLMTKLITSLPVGSIRNKGKDAVEFLLNGKKLLRMKVGNGIYLLHVSMIEFYLSLEKPIYEKIEEVKDTVDIDRADVLSAYEKIKQQKGFSNIEIYELKKELGVQMETLKSLLLEESKNGRVVLSLGDWSLSSENVRSGGVVLDGRPHLLVRFL